jgi:hypothetical protein
MVKSAVSQEIAGELRRMIPTNSNPGDSENPPGGTAENPCGSDATVGGGANNEATPSLRYNMST